jgi:hypothetical protein
LLEKPTVATEPSVYIYPHTEGTDYTSREHFVPNDRPDIISHPSSRRIGSFANPDFYYNQPVGTLSAVMFYQYPNFNLTNFSVEGSVGPITSELTKQTFSYSLTGLDTQCSSGPGTIANSCGIHFHEGSTCTDPAMPPGGHMYNMTSDPWLNVAYTSDAAGEAEGEVSVETGYFFEGVEGKTVVVHDYDGTRIACAVIGRGELVGNDVAQKRYVYLDSTYSVGKAFMGKEVVAMPPADVSTPYEVVSAGAAGKFFGFSTCQWIRKCETWEFPGSSCSGAVDGHWLTGYCYTSDVGTLECGRTLKTTDAYGLNMVQRNMDTMDGPEVKITPSRCPRGTPLLSEGEVLVRRLLVGGCMLSNDTNYSATAEVHVPQACFSPADYWKGCMFPGATNYDPSAKQMGDCWWQTRGCTDSGAVNYNVEASIDDGSCIVAKLGCTVHEASYEGVEAPTPNYKGRFVGMELRSVGHSLEFNDTVNGLMWNYDNVLNYDSNANVLHGCVVAIEGCMDSTAINYDSKANRNTNTWCIPPVVGCMMPSDMAPKDNYEDNRVTTGAVHARDGLAINFNPAATVHDSTSCIIERYGCMSSTALNYEPHATVNWECWEPHEGCLNPAAANFNCSIQQFTACTGANAPAASIPRVSVHAPIVCVFATAAPAFPPPSPAHPPIAPLGSILTVFTTEVVLLFDGTLDDFDEQVLYKISEQLCVSVLGIDASYCVSTAASASVKVTTVVTSADEAASDAAAATARTALLTAAAIDTVFTGFGLTALAGAEVKQVQVYSIVNAPPSPPPGPDWPAIIGGTVGGVVGFLLILGVIYYMKKRKSNKVEA